MVVTKSQGAHAVGDGLESLRVDLPRVGGGPADDQPGAKLPGEAFDLVEIDRLGVWFHPVGDDIVELPGKVDRRTVGQVSPMRQVHGQDRVARFQGEKIHGHVGLGAGMRLDVGMVGPKKPPGPFASQLLGHVDFFAASVIALARIAFRVLVRQHGTHCRQNGGRNHVLRGDQLDLAFLPMRLPADNLRDFRIALL